MSDVLVFAEIGSNFQQVGGECPEGWIVMSGLRPDDDQRADYTAQADGSWTVSDETIRAKLISEEVIWRSAELQVIARQMEALEEEEAADPGDGPADLLPGTRKQWLRYRSLVSNWADSAAGFPNQSDRPVRP